MVNSPGSVSDTLVQLPGILLATRPITAAHILHPRSFDCQFVLYETALAVMFYVVKEQRNQLLTYDPSNAAILDLCATTCVPESREREKLLPVRKVGSKCIYILPP